MTLEKHNLVRFAIDAKSSRLTVQAFASGFVSVLTHSPKFAIRNFVGEIAFHAEAVQNASVQLLVNVRSFEFIEEATNFDRKELQRLIHTQVLESNNISTVDYKSSRVSATKMGDNLYRTSVLGDLNLHGITRAVGFDAQVIVEDDAINAQGSFPVMQSDFGLNIPSMAGGRLKFKDELKCEYNFIARRQR
jgi:polyisoprenoid-binding protein YceI